MLEWRNGLRYCHPVMSKLDCLSTVAEALPHLDQIKRILDLYKVGREDESKELPLGLMVTPDSLRAISLLVRLAEAYVAGFKYIAMNGYGWGSSVHPWHAIKQCKSQQPPRMKSTPIDLYIAHPDTEVFSDGSWSYPQGFSPVKINPSK